MGEKVRGDIAKRDIPEAKYNLPIVRHISPNTCSFRLKQLYEKFDDVVANGRMIAKTSEMTDDGKMKGFVNNPR